MLLTEVNGLVCGKVALHRGVSVPPPDGAAARGRGCRGDWTGGYGGAAGAPTTVAAGRRRGWRGGGRGRRLGCCRSAGRRGWRRCGGARLKQGGGTGDEAKFQEATTVEYAHILFSSSPVRCRFTRGGHCKVSPQGCQISLRL